jgi:heme-degrading monooxygenase HmoA
VILEVAILNVVPGQAAEFEQAFAKAQKIISGMSGYLSHELQRCIEIENQYILLVRWETVEAHETGFRQSVEYQQWKKLLHHFYSPFPSVHHYEPVS